MTARDWQTLVNRGAEALAEHDMEHYATFIPRSKLSVSESEREGYRIKAALVLRAAYALPAEPYMP